MPDAGKHNIVFVIKPETGVQKVNLQWCEDIKLAVLKLLWHFTFTPLPKSSDMGQMPNQIKWAYRFMGSHPNNAAGLEWKDLEVSELSSLEKDIMNIFNQNRQVESLHDNDALHLEQELMSIVHDYDWETTHELSPSKRGKSAPMKSNHKSISHEWANASLDCLLKSFSDKENCYQNIVVLLLPAPSSQAELNAFFEYEEGDVSQKYISSRLMPYHLRQYFRGKYGISLLWIDTSVVQPRSKQAPKQDYAGIIILRDYLRSRNGDLISFSALCPCAGKNISEIDDTRQGFCTSNWQDFNSSRDATLTSAIPLPDLLEIFSKRTDFQNEMEANFHMVHVCEKEALDRGGVKKLWTMSINENHLDTSTNIKFCDRCGCKPVHVHNGKVYPVDFCDMNVSTSTVNLCISKVAASDGCNATPQTVFVVVGLLPLSLLTLVLDGKKLRGLTPIWCNLEPFCTYPNPSDLKHGVLIAKVHKYCTMCGGEPSVESSSRYVIMKVVRPKVAVIMLFSSEVSELLKYIPCDSPPPSKKSASPDQPPARPLCYSSVMGTKEVQVNLQQPASFETCLLENWFQLAKQSQLDSILDIKESDCEQQDACTEDKVSDIISCLQNHYACEKNTLVERAENIPTNVRCGELEPDWSCTNGKSLSSLQRDYEKTLETRVDFSTVDSLSANAESYLHNARCVVSHVLQDCNDENKNVLNIMNEHFFLSSNDVKKSLDGTEQGSMIMMQILLRMEVAKHFNSMRESIEIADEVTSLLRLLALSIGPGVMETFLESILMESYQSGCGKLLYDIHSELLRPIPQSLEQYLIDESELTGDFLSDPSLCDNTPSIRTNVKSSLSYSFLESSTRNTRQGMSHSSIAKCLIEVPLLPRDKSETRMFIENPDANSRQGRLRTSNENCSANTDSNDSKIHPIKRDLFSDLDAKSNILLQLSGSPPASVVSKRRLKVSDTPNVKKHMTALSRQRLRLRKEEKSEPEQEALTIIEESPAKLEGNPPSPRAVVNRSNTTTLTRRHSFYCSGVESRNAVRASIIQKHHQAMPSTPELSKNQKLLEACNQSSEDSIFKNGRSPVKVPCNKLASLPNAYGRSGRSGHCRSATKALFQTPVKPAGTDGNQGICCAESTPAGNTDAVTDDSTKPPKGGETTGNSNFHTSGVCGFVYPVPTVKKSAQKRQTQSLNVDQTRHVRGVMLQTSLDSFVIRTPSSVDARLATGRCQEKKKEISQDDTPTRDEIQWPRRKRGIDKSSPRVVSKRRKKLFNNSK